MNIKVNRHGDSAFAKAYVTAEICIRYDEKTEFMSEMNELLDKYAI